MQIMLHRAIYGYIRYIDGRIDATHDTTQLFTRLIPSTMLEKVQCGSKDYTLLCDTL